MIAGNEESSKSVFVLSDGEMERRMALRLDELKKEIFAKGLTLTYQDNRCPTPDHFIREYEDGRVHLAIFAPEKEEFRFVKDITHG